MGNNTQEARLRELWSTYLLDAPNDIPIDIFDPAHQAIERIRLYKTMYDKYVSEDDHDKSALAVSRALTLWKLLSLDIGGWLADMPLMDISIRHPESWKENERIALQAVLKFQEASVPHAHRPAIDPVPIIIPAWIVVLLRTALDALDCGEVQPIVRPEAGGRHDNPWTWDQMRACALEHVAFLRGQGTKAKDARKRIADAMGISPDTLRDYGQSKSLIIGCETAFDAGRIKIMLEDNPDYASNDGNSIDSATLARLIRFRAEPLSTFGKRYRERFGQRHQYGAAGD